MPNIKKKKILLVGSSGVLGSEYAKFFYDKKSKLIISDIESPKYQRIRKKIKKSKITFLRSNFRKWNNKNGKRCEQNL